MIKIKSNQSAWNFIFGTVYNSNSGEFRIHTNKKGIKLYLSFSNRIYTGYNYEHLTYYERTDIENRSREVYHPDIKFITDAHYNNSVVGANLIDAVNLHINKFPGDVRIPTSTELNSHKSTLSIDEFVANYIKEDEYDNEYTRDEIKELFNV